MKISKHSILLYIMAICLVAGSSGYLRLLNGASFVIKFIEGIMVLYYLYLNLFKVHKIEKYSALIIVFYALLLLSTIMGTKDYSTFFVCMIQGISATLFLEYEIRHNYVNIIKVLRNVLLAFLIVNLFLLLVAPNGFAGSGAQTYYFLGYRIGFTPFVVAELFFSFCYDFLTNTKLSRFTIFFFFLGYATVIIKNVSTGIAGITIVLILITIFYFIKRCIDYKLFLILYGIVFIGIVFFEIQYKSSTLSYFLIDVLGKEDLTFDNRTTIWAATILDFMKSPILGHGSGALVSVNFVYSTPLLPAHNQILSILNEGGLLSLGIFILINLQIDKSIKKVKHSFLEIILLSFLAGYFLMMITEIQTTKALVFLIFATAVHLPNIIYEKDKGTLITFDK